MMHTILPIKLVDFISIWQIEQASHAFPWSAKFFAGNQGKRYFNFKLCVGNRVVAFSITQTILDEALLFNIAVHPKFQRKGYARALIRYLIVALEQRQVLTLWLEVRQSNLPAITLYRTLGFNEVSIRRNYYPSANGRENAVIMALPLD